MKVGQTRVYIGLKLYS